MWKVYDKAAGFGVRKNYQHKSKVDGIVNRGSYVCCKEGFKRNNRNQANNNRRWDTRTGCLVSLIVIYDRTCKQYKVQNFVNVHNHVLETPDTVHMIRSYRQVTDAHGCAISVATDAGLTPSETHVLMVIETRGRQNLGYMLEDKKSTCVQEDKEI